jgi:transposase-like protein
MSETEGVVFVVDDDAPMRRSLENLTRSVCEIAGCSVHLASMSTCPSYHQRATKRDGYDVAARQRYHCRPCHRDFTAHSTSAFSGYRWPADVILMAVRWYCSLPLSAAQVVRLLAERKKLLINL